MDTLSLKERIQNKQGIARIPKIRALFDLYPPWRLFGYVNIIKQPQV